MARSLAATVVGLVFLGSVVIAAAAPAPPPAEPTGPTGSASAGPRANQVAVPHRPAGADPTIGPDHAPVTAELFFVPGAGSSRQIFLNLLELQRKHPRRLRVVFRVVSRQGHILVPEAALEAHAQGRFTAFMEEVTSARSGVRREQVVPLAVDAGLDLARLDRAWDDGRHEEQLAANERRRSRRHLRNLPDLLFNARPVEQPASSMDLDELEAAYDEAHAIALDLLDQGVPPGRLLGALERAADAAAPPPVVAPGMIDDPERTFADVDDELELPIDASIDQQPPLLAGRLALDGLPTRGPPDASVLVVMACNVRLLSCARLESAVRKIAELFPGEVRVVWLPWFDDEGDGADGYRKASRAVLCAEAQGAGWRYLEQALLSTARAQGRSADLDEDIGKAAEGAELDGDRFEACMASGDDGPIRRRVAAARAAGIRAAPSLVVGGRLYIGGVGEARVLQELVEAELAPGLLEQLAPGWR